MASSPRATDDIRDAVRLRFQQRYDVGQTAPTPCFARLVSDWTQCNHDCTTSGLAAAEPPHQPVPADDADLWYRDGEPAVYALHVPHLNHDQLAGLRDTCDIFELERAIEPASYRAPTHLATVVLLPEDRQP